MFKEVASKIALGVEVVAVLIVAYGAIEAFLGILKPMLGRPKTQVREREYGCASEYGFCSVSSSSGGRHRAERDDAHLGRNRPTGSDCRHPHLPELLSGERRRAVCRAKTRSGDTNVSQRGSPRGPIAGPLFSSSVKLRNLSPSRGARRRKFVAASAPTRRDCSRPGRVVVE